MQGRPADGPRPQPPDAPAGAAEAAEEEGQPGADHRRHQPHRYAALATLRRVGGAAAGEVGQEELRQLEDLLRLRLAALRLGGPHPAVTELPHAAALQPPVPLLAQVHIEGLCLLGAPRVAQLKVLVNLADAGGLGGGMKKERRG